MVEVLAVEGVTLEVLDHRALDFAGGLERVISRSAALDDTGGVRWAKRRLDRAEEVWAG